MLFQQSKRGEQGRGSGEGWAVGPGPALGHNWQCHPLPGRSPVGAGGLVTPSQTGCWWALVHCTVRETEARACTASVSRARDS